MIVQTDDGPFCEVTLLSIADFELQFAFQDDDVGLVFTGLKVPGMMRQSILKVSIAYMRERLGGVA